MKLPNIVHDSWHPHLKELFEDERMIVIKEQILPSCKFHPNPENIFRVFSMPLDNIKVVILGQDPYPNDNALGLAFAIPQEVKLTASLRVIENEVALSQGHISYDMDKTLQSWVDQGVFLLNMALTVQKGLPSSHSKYWKWFTKEVIKIIDTNCKNVVWMLWGKHAQTAEVFISNGHILKACHPAAEAYGSAKFKGCGHFTKANELLEHPINWLKGDDKLTIINM